MLKILPKTSHQLSICEGNFLRLKKVLQNFKKNKYLFETINPNKTSNPIVFTDFSIILIITPIVTTSSIN